MTDVYYKMNSYLSFTDYNECDDDKKLELINKLLRIYLTEKIKEKNPNDKFISGYTKLSVETLLTILNDDNITDDVIHYLMSCVSNMQGFEIIWCISDQKKDKNNPVLRVNNGMIDSLTTYKDYDGADVYKFFENSVKNIYCLIKK